ncbi:hypothetical protein LAUMK4_02536 [Mycobacterium persicum]|uniref:Uncharacterized protein n=1 Tax=Mycobacterium persicum TaxID=1487726 RepID=A0AB38V1H5_9MYCO|nr:hypothetical protein [Mycobacterium persicum]VAZ75559.1 hypothetical protein LAUMK15_02861 [Mycobacterium persicum]VAZ86623.1 hypothetical protein LAUMK42_05475 [Mycobacterium persicum]VAZ93670.1 hypothetical protein LAUMK4_02536 [Mycobacterium persicum]
MTATYDEKQRMVFGANTYRREADPMSLNAIPAAGEPGPLVTRRRRDDRLDRVGPINFLRVGAGAGWLGWQLEQ